MDVKARDRRRIAREIASVVRHRDFRNAFTLVDHEGRHRFISVLPDDPMSLVFGRLAEMGGAAYLVTTGRDGLRFASMMQIWAGAHRRRSRDDEPVCPIHPHSQVGMLFDYLETIGRPMICREAQPDVQMALVDSFGPGVPCEL